MLNITTQPLFCAVLKYLQQGTFADFKQACDLVLGQPYSGAPYLYHNLFQAAHIAGLLEVDFSKGAMQWWTAFEGDICIRSCKPKAIGTTQEWFAEKGHEARPLVATSGGNALILGRDERTSSRREAEVVGIFESSMTKWLPRYQHIERQVTITEPVRYESEPIEEVFILERHAWEPTPSKELPDLQLYRSRREYSAYTYYLQSRELGLRFRVTQPEWTFVVAYNLLPWSLGTLMSIREDTITVSQKIRLPVLILRYLFSAAQSVSIGRVIRFVGVDTALVKDIEGFFSKEGDANAQ